MSTNDPHPEGATPPPASPWQAPPPSAPAAPLYQTPAEPMPQAPQSPGTPPAMPTQPMTPPAQPFAVPSATPQVPAQGTAYGQPALGQIPGGPGPLPGQAPGQSFAPPPSTFNGAPMPAAMPPAKNSKVGLIIALVAIAAVVIGVIALVVNTFASGLTGSSSSSSADQTVTVGDWEIEVLGCTADATDVMDASGISNDPAPSGKVYALVEVKVTYKGSDSSGESYIYQDFQVRTSSGFTTGWQDSNAVAPNDLFGRFMTVLKPGESASGNIVFDVPKGEALTFVFIDEEGHSAEVPLH